MSESVWNVLACLFLVAALLHFVRASRTRGPRVRSRYGLGAASIAWAAAAALFQREPRVWSYVAMGFGLVLTVLSALLSARDGP